MVAKKIKQNRTVVNSRVLCAHIESLSGINPEIEPIHDQKGVVRYYVKYRGVQIFCRNRGEVQACLSAIQGMETFDRLFDPPKEEVFFGLRICSTGLYFPANGAKKSKLLIKAVPFGKTLDDKLFLEFSGAGADLAAKTMSMGKEFHCVAMSTGKKGNYTVLRFFLGNDSTKHINNEITMGIRPDDWDKPGSEGWEAWKQILKARMETKYNPDKYLFGYAKNMNRNPYM